MIFLFVVIDFRRQVVANITDVGGLSLFGISDFVFDN